VQPPDSQQAGSALAEGEPLGPNVSTSQYPNISISQYVHISISQHLNISISQLLNFSMSQYINIAISQNSYISISLGRRFVSPVKAPFISRHNPLWNWLIILLRTPSMLTRDASPLFLKAEMPSEPLVHYLYRYVVTRTRLSL
jgi:hypothetical protein